MIPWPSAPIRAGFDFTDPAQVAYWNRVDQKQLTHRFVEHGIDDKLAGYLMSRRMEVETEMTRRLHDEWEESPLPHEYAEIAFWEEAVMTTFKSFAEANDYLTRLGLEPLPSSHGKTKARISSRWLTEPFCTGLSVSEVIAAAEVFGTHDEEERALRFFGAQRGAARFLLDSGIPIPVALDVTLAVARSAGTLQYNKAMVWVFLRCDLLVQAYTRGLDMYQVAALHNLDADTEMTLDVVSSGVPTEYAILLLAGR